MSQKKYIIEITIKVLNGETLDTHSFNVDDLTDQIVSNEFWGFVSGYCDEIGEHVGNLRSFSAMIDMDFLDFIEKNIENIPSEYNSTGYKYYDGLTIVTAKISLSNNYHQ